MAGEMTHVPAASAGGGRPWQATALGVLDIIGTVFAFLFAIMFFFLNDMITGFFSDAGLEGVDGADEAFSMLGNFSTGIGVTVLIFAVLGIFMARGAFKGQKWSPIVSIVFAVLSIAGGLMNFDTSQLFSLVVQVFVLYCAGMSVKNPYFNR